MYSKWRDSFVKALIDVWEKMTCSNEDSYTCEWFSMCRCVLLINQLPCTKQSEKDATETFFFPNLRWESFIYMFSSPAHHALENVRLTVVKSYITVVHRSLCCRITFFSFQFCIFLLYFFLDENNPSHS